MPIHLLPPDLIHRIAAGEVIERPASVVKELVENSLDAGARQVTVEVEGGGVKLIRVTDDGAGIPEAELDLAVQRHATSKLSGWEEFARIGSLGFRGEALASIAAVSDLTLISRPPAQTTAASRYLRDGTIVDRGRRAQAPGTSVTVRHLFRHLPGRLKFLRSDRAESGAVQVAVARYALAYPDVRFRLSIEGRTVLSTPGDGDLAAAAGSVLNVSASAFTAIEPGEGTPITWIGGVLGLPATSRPNRSGLLVMINRRPVDNTTLRFALEEAYQGYLGVGRHPLAVLQIVVPGEDIDVNVHPTKAEVRLVAERFVAAAVHRAVRATLARTAPIPTWEEAAGSLAGGDPGAAPDDSQDLAAPPAPAAAAGPLFAAPVAAGAPVGELPPLRVLGQAGLTYVTAEGPDGIYLIDQHAAHERVTYERLRSQHAAQSLEQQGLLAPDVIDLDLDLMEHLVSEAKHLAAIGFLVEPFGDAQAIVRAVPAVLAGRDPAAGLRDVLRQAGLRLDGLAWIDRALTTLACHGSLRAGQQLTLDDMAALLSQLEATPNARTCPHGRPTIVHLSASQLERQFGRR